jgi:hypothetical protein
MYDHLISSDVKVKQSTVGSQLVGVIVANGLLPFRPGCGVSKEK